MEKEVHHQRCQNVFFCLRANARYKPVTTSLGTLCSPKSGVITAFTTEEMEGWRRNEGSWACEDGKAYWVISLWCFFHLLAHTHRKNMLARRWELEQGQLAHLESSNWVPLQITSWQLKLSPVCVSYNVCACWSLLRQLPPDSCSGWGIYMSTIISSKKNPNRTTVYNLPRDTLTSKCPRPATSLMLSMIGPSAPSLTDAPYLSCEEGEW